MDAIDQLVAPLRDYVQRILANRQPSERQVQLQQAAKFISARLSEGRTADLTFICTHNSRRSHFAQVWAETAARLLKLNDIRCFSGGIEATACNPRTVKAFVRAGFSVEIPANAELNPRIKIHHQIDAPPIECFSKVYLENGNPTSDYAAMMCCSDVDEKCPVVTGSAIRVPLHYEDPKQADDTPDEEGRYDDRCWQIGCDMFRMMEMVQISEGSS